jgi:hypothetical protein
MVRPDGGDFFRYPLVVLGGDDRAGQVDGLGAGQDSH